MLEQPPRAGPRPGPFEHRREGGAAGSLVTLSGADQINGSHRGHHQFLSKALGYRPRPASTRARRWRRRCRPAAAHAGRDPRLGAGLLQGRGGSMHLQWAEAGALGTNAIVGGGVPMAAGAARSHKHAGTDAVAITYFGDGAVNIGSVLETMNWRRRGSFRCASSSRTTLRGVDHGGGIDRRAAPVRTRTGLQHPQLEGRRHGSAGRAPPRRKRWRTCAPARARPSSRPTCTASSTRTAPSPAAPSATAAGRGTAMARARPARTDGAPHAGARHGQRRRDRRAARARQAGHARGRRRADRGRSFGQAGQAPHPPRAVAQPGLPRRRHPQRPARAAGACATPSRTASAASWKRASSSTWWPTSCTGACRPIPRWW